MERSRHSSVPSSNHHPLPSPCVRPLLRRSSFLVFLSSHLYPPVVKQRRSNGLRNFYYRCLRDDLSRLNSRKLRRVSLPSAERSRAVEFPRFVPFSSPLVPFRRSEVVIGRLRIVVYLWKVWGFEDDSKIRRDVQEHARYSKRNIPYDG